MTLWCNDDAGGRHRRANRSDTEGCPLLLSGGGRSSETWEGGMPWPALSTPEVGLVCWCACLLCPFATIGPVRQPLLSFIIPPDDTHGAFVTIRHPSARLYWPDLRCIRTDFQELVAPPSILNMLNSTVFVQPTGQIQASIGFTVITSPRRW